ncbi:MAG: ATP-dependent DNA helicase [Burkholderiales bacterium]
MTSPEVPLPYTIAVRALCEFTAKVGDLDLRFTPSPSADEGMAGHRLVAARRGAGYQTELALSGQHRHLQVRGRADGFDAARGRLEEIKTHKGRLDAMPANHRALHWAQLRVYGALLCAAKGLPALELALVYLDITTQRETVFIEHCTAAALQQAFEAQCERFLAWAAQESAHRAARDAALQQLAFVHPSFRAGQRTLAEAVYRAAVAGRCLLAQAPTGIGKTVATLFAQLKACPGQRLDKLFYLTAKTTGRALALQALAQIRQAAPTLPLRALELVARDKACEHPDKACHGGAQDGLRPDRLRGGPLRAAGRGPCPLARGFYDRLPAARAAAVQAGTLDRATLRSVALAHDVCPYYLGQELVRWSDVVVGDYNHCFDLHALLHSLTQAHDWRVGLLVDEAHNLVERGRRMYTAELSWAGLLAARRAAPAVLKPELEKLQRRWRELNATLAADYSACDAVPGPWLEALRQAVMAWADWSEAGQGGSVDEPVAGPAPALASPGLFEPAEDGQGSVPTDALRTFGFEAQRLLRLAELFGPHALCDITRHLAARRGGIDTSVCIRNVVPAPMLQARFAAAHTVTLFSATLAPADYHRDILGLPADTAWVDVPSPFRAEQLRLRIAGQVSTRYRHRERSLPALLGVMAQQYGEQPGNYLAFFSSHAYLLQVAALFEAQHPHIPVWRQRRGMTEPERDAFLDRMTATSRGIGFAVLGGAFSEGVDLPGRRLIGAFIATLGMPQVNPVNEQIRQRLDQLFGAGHDYTYVVPGLHKVVQAAGRVIRSSTDEGIVVLLDDRYHRPEVQRLLPAWWQLG